VKIFRDKTFGLIPLRTLVLITMLGSPLLVYAVSAGLAIWKLGWMKWLWWLAPLVWAITWMLSKLWKPDPTPELTPLQASHWTPRDRQAAEIVRRFQQEVDFFTGDQLADPRFYFNQGLKIANELAKHYDPNTQDPVSQRTLPEILAACRLVADDLEQIVLTSVPGSRMLTVNQWKKLGDAPKVVRQLSKGFWATSILLNPFSLASWGTSKVTNEKVTNDLQTELLITLYMRFVRQLGYYLIEMNSGRLRGGADMYRSSFPRDLLEEELRFKSEHSNRSSASEAEKGKSASDTVRESAGLGRPTGIPHSSEKSPRIPSLDQQLPTKLPERKNLPPLKIAVLGQRGSGKTELVNAFSSLSTNENQDTNKGVSEITVTKTRLATRTIKRHRFYSPQLGNLIELIDTPGYDATEIQTKRKWRGKNELLNGIKLAANEANAILLILNLQQTDRQADRALLAGVRESYAQRANLKPPAVIAVLIFPIWEGEASESQLAPPVTSNKPLTRPDSNSATQSTESGIPLESRGLQQEKEQGSGSNGVASPSTEPVVDDQQLAVPSRIKADPNDRPSEELESPRTVSELVQETREFFGDLVDEVTPLFHDTGDDAGCLSVQDSVKENLLPSLAQQLDAMQSAARLIAYEDSLNRARYRILLQQAKNSGQKLFSGWLDARARRKGKG